MSTVPTPDTTLARIKAWLPVVLAATAILGFAANEYHWLKSGGNGPPPAPPVIEVAEVAPAPKLAAAKPELRHGQHVLAARIAVRVEMRKAGHTRAEIDDALDLIDYQTLNAAVAEVSRANGAAVVMPQAAGDGSIIRAILDWFKGPEGQAVIGALIKLLLAALGL